MKALTFRLKEEPPERLDLSPLTPQKLAGMARGDIEKIRVGTSKRGLLVGDVFRLSGSDAGAIVFEGGSARFDRVGAELAEGSVRVAGDVGAQAGRLMSGGTLTVDGIAGPHAGSGMRGGRLEITGDAGDQLGGPLAGEMAGMNGGVLIVRGRAGARAGDRMRRGLIAVLKGAGDYAGCRMIAGTLVVTGGVGDLPGYLMRRGSILLDRAPQNLSPSFVESGAPDISFAAVLDRHLIAEGILRRPLLSKAPRKYGGDNAVLGLGEILFPR
ncbi:formylmethanofuran dehydrogenase subunit C [Mesorhizobium sp. IMUNJ 23232]|uniref:formylmethanofuran dehydrogenase subunit C n=1 Tax=Mesorhizobium sp. IMUNJ 23232 TaxID=3376064 RepID=UPI00378AEBA3